MPINVTTLTNRIGESRDADLPIWRQPAPAPAPRPASTWPDSPTGRPPTTFVPTLPTMCRARTLTGNQILKGQTVKTFVINVEENAALGRETPQFWYMAKYGGADDLRQRTTRRAAWTGRRTSIIRPSRPTARSTRPSPAPWPKTLLRAGDPASMIASIKEALATIDGEIGIELGPVAVERRPAHRRRRVHLPRDLRLGTLGRRRPGLRDQHRRHRSARRRSGRPPRCCRQPGDRVDHELQRRPAGQRQRRHQFERAARHQLQPGQFRRPHCRSASAIS